MSGQFLVNERGSLDAELTCGGGVVTVLYTWAVSS